MVFSATEARGKFEPESTTAFLLASVAETRKHPSYLQVSVMNARIARIGNVDQVFIKALGGYLLLDTDRIDRTDR